MATVNPVSGLWIKPLQQMFWSALAASGWTPPVSDAANISAQIDQDVLRPEKWFFTNDGLQTSFDSYEGGCYPCNPGYPTIPWTKLKTILRENAPVP
jgi:hypothetical protein